MENTIVLNSAQKIEVLFQDEVSLDIDCSLVYVKSGEKEISSYVTNVAQPTLAAIIETAETEMAVQIANGVETAKISAANAAAEAINTSITTAENTLTEYVGTNIIPVLDEKIAVAEATVQQTSAHVTSTAASESQASDCAEQASASAAEAVSASDAAMAAASQASAAAAKASWGNIGDIKYTARIDVPNGGVWCDGTSYSKTQFPDFYQMLLDSKLHKTTMAAYDESVAANGVCGYFGLDVETETFKVPLLQNVYLKSGTSEPDFSAESLPNISGYIRTGHSLGLFGTGVAAGAISNYGETRQSAAGNSGGYQYAEGLSIDASRSSAVYQDDARVNPDHVVYRAYVILYSAITETVSIIKDYEIYNTLPLLTPLWLPQEVNDANWLKSSGQWNDGLIYNTVYNYLTQQYDAAEDMTQVYTAAGGTQQSITYRLTADKLRIAASDTDVDTLFSLFGTAWIYVLDKNNNRFKLPRSTKYAKFSEDAAGLDIFESLPDITGTFVSGTWTGGGAAGAFYDTGTNHGSDSSGNDARKIFGFAASLSSPVYQNNASVNPTHTTGYLYFKVGNTAANAQLVDCGRMLNSLSQKADTGLNNIIQSGRQNIMKWILPDYEAGVSVPYPKPASPFTAPVNGFYIVYVQFSNSTNAFVINGIASNFIQGSSASYRDATSLCIPLNKGDVIYLNQTSYSSYTGTFYPCKGEN